ncbi:hypothetical protein CONPUDRAFT_162612 [Coniophora puteana RWD-64-598 SS2]|uniref:Zn(2)-C6 fungal-type domain-containing protein n=1 Tax=Coniophora puteana (strain RWD-64-598) TaxID=741705 RepID=A0A5M3N1Z3_CONPW|nr:uncharacterized protein CONPUDRAFT_162612 [Coniophora puteana RWD-64-598 SS2]EIW85412.1 hypothetical protein CONPUDRAFT_162612 [Coniophora puteana RWD-64-598 SS2]
MSPRASRNASSTPSAPYTKRATGQPKSSRQQFSACGACRMRRVRCDLKDVAMADPTSLPSCSNCKERGIKCVDEFAEVKAVKNLRRGRRLQQVEAVYGKVASDGPMSRSIATSSAVGIPSPINTSGPSVIPQLNLEFFRSPFFRRFNIQRPIIEPSEFTSRYFAHVEGTSSIGVEGEMIAMLLVIWAASFGVNECGIDVEEFEPPSPISPTHPATSQDDDSYRRVRAMRTDAMTREALRLIDIHGILRRPTWDGVRVLLLILPLTQGILSPMERIAMQEATLAQVHTLCFPPSPEAENAIPCEPLVRARVFWYANVQEAITQGLRDGRLVFDDDDLLAFQNSLPPQYAMSSPLSRPSSSHSGTLPGSPISQHISSMDHPRASLVFQITSHYFSHTLAVARICREIHVHLTGPRARRRCEGGVPVDQEALTRLWDEIEQSWEEFEQLRRSASSNMGDLVRGEDVERFVSSWQIFIFECLNVIRESLKKCILSLSPPGSPNFSEPRRSSSASSTYSYTVHLHSQAVRRCRIMLPRILAIVGRHLEVSTSGFFAYEAGLVCDGIFFAALILAQGDIENDGEILPKNEDGFSWDVEAEEGVDICLRALRQLGWAHAQSEMRQRTIHAVWGARMRRSQCNAQDPVHNQAARFTYSSSQNHDYLAVRPPMPTEYHQQVSLALVSAAGQSRPHLPPLSLGSSQGHVDSAPNTAVSDGSCAWPPYTPPTTAGSMTCQSSSSTSSGSPHVLPMPTLKHPQLGAPNLDTDTYGVEVNPFAYDVDDTIVSEPVLVQGPWSSPYSQGSSKAFFDPNVMFPTSNTVLTPPSTSAGTESCQQFTNFY